MHFAVTSQPGLTSSRWFLFTAGALTLVLLFCATWYAGKVSGELEAERISIDLNRLKQKVAETQLELEKQKEQTARVERAVSNAGHSDAIALVSKLRQQLLQSQAEANQYKEVVNMEQRALKENTELLDALSSPGVHFLAMKGSEAAADSTAYALIVESSRMVFVASNLPKPPEGKQYQLWVLRRQEPKLVSAGVFSPDESNRALMDFDTPAVLSDIAELEVTEEPAGGSEAPTGSKLFAGTAEKTDRSDD